MNEISEKRLEILSKIRKLSEELTILQSECHHLNVVKKYRSDTGNYSKSDDSYWAEFNCPDCGKHWTEEGSK